MKVHSVLRARRLGIAVAMLLCVVFTASGAQAATVKAVIRGAGGSVMNVALANPSGNSPKAQSLIKQLKNNLAIVPFLATLDGASIPGGGNVSPTGEGLDFRGFFMAGAQLLVTSNWTDANNVELRVFDVGSGTRLMGNRYNVAGAEGVENMADIFCDDLLQSVIGKSALFRSTIAFVKTDGKRKRDLWTVKANGRDLQRVTNIKGEVLSPTWSFDSSQVLFSHIDARSHGLGVWNAKTKSTQRIKFPGNTVIGPCFLPDGRVAVSLTDGRNPSIFALSSSYQKLGRLDSSGAIEVSPSVDATGTKMVFTSSRLGNPHVFLKDMQTGSVRRVSQGGVYNSDPAISPDGTVVVYARQMGGGHRLFVYDLVTGVENQITFGPGSDEAPEFSSDSYFIAFMSTRNGKRQLFLTTRDGATPRLIPTGVGDAQMPAWSKVKD